MAQEKQVGTYNKNEFHSQHGKTKSMFTLTEWTGKISHRTSRIFVANSKANNITALTVENIDTMTSILIL